MGGEGEDVLSMRCVAYDVGCTVGLEVELAGSPWLGALHSTCKMRVRQLILGTL